MLTHDVACLLAALAESSQPGSTAQLSTHAGAKVKASERERRRVNKKEKKVFGSFNKAPLKEPDCVLDRART